MDYQYAAAADYEDLAGGRVLVHLPGQVAFPVRLASELFQRCTVHLAGQGRSGPYHLYDPCCGAAYHLTVLAFLHGQQIASITASDIDEAALQTAARNLSLLTPQGLARRRAQIARLLAAYGKESHRAALASADRLRDRLAAHEHPIPVELFRADSTRPFAADQATLLSDIDIVIADTPYGRGASWQFDEPPAGADRPPALAMLDALSGVLPAHTILAVATANRQKLRHDQLRRLAQLRAGKRRITLFAT